MPGHADLHYTPLTFKGECYAFCTACSAEYVATQTTFLSPSNSVFFDAIPRFVKLTVFGYEAGMRRAVPIGTAFMKVGQAGHGQQSRVKIINGKFTVVTRNCELHDVTGDVGKAVAEHQTRCEAYFKLRLRELELTQTSTSRPYVHTYMLESELPLDWRVSCIRGWPQMDSLSGLTADEAARSFEKCLHVAKRITCFDTEVALRDAENTWQSNSENLFVSAMRVYSGVYPDGTETIDDRSLGCLKLCTNSDCDDMSITVAAFFNRLKRGDCTSLLAVGDLFGAHSVLTHALDTYTSVYCVQGLVQTSVAVPRAMNWLWSRKTGGHVWCMLRRTNGTFSHMECTRCVASSVCNGELDCFGDHPQSESLEKGLAKCDASRYEIACAAYTTDSMILPVHGPTTFGGKTVGVAYTDFANNQCAQAVVVSADAATLAPVSGDLGDLIDRLRHRPSHAQLERAVLAAPKAFTRDHIFLGQDVDAPDGMETIVYGALSKDAVCHWNVSPCVTWAGQLNVGE